MPSTVWDVLNRRQTGTEYAGVVPWGVPPKIKTPGLYVLSLSADPNLLDGQLGEAPISLAALDEWLRRCPNVHLKGEHPNAEALAAHLNRFWFADECVLYVGRTGRALSKRVSEYHSTSLGAKKPHHGGYFIATLDRSIPLYVHCAIGKGDEIEERHALLAFSEGLSEASRARLGSPLDGLPFANIKWPTGGNKEHGLTGATCE